MRSFRKKIILFFKGDNLFVSIIILLIIILSSILIYDYNKSVVSIRKKTIGTLVFKNNIVRRKFSNQVIWDDLDERTILLNEDTVLTGSISEAVINLSNGTVIEVGENSMILLEIKENEAYIDLAQGFIQAKTGNKNIDGPGITVKSSDKKISLKDGEMKIARTEMNDLKISVQKGKAVLDFKGKKKSIKEGERAQVSRNTVSIQEIPILLIHPVENKRYFSSQDTLNIDFKWKQQKKARDIIKKIYLFEISSQRAFNTIKRRFSVDDTAIKIDLGPGIYFWRISSRNEQIKKTTISEIKKFTIIQDFPVQLFSPENGASINFVSSLPMINFSWQKKENASAYILEISDTKSFTTTVKRIESQVTRFLLKWELNISSLKKTQYYWRVIAKSSLPDLSNNISPVYSFTLAPQKEVNPPVLILPENNYKIIQALFKKGNVILKWKKANDIIQSRIYIAKDEKFKTLIFKSKTKTNFAVLKEVLPTGIYYWRVLGIDRNNRNTNFSAVRSFTVSKIEKIYLIAPENKANIYMPEVETSGIHFKWRKPIPFGLSVLELSNNKNFSKNIISKSVTASVGVITSLKPGNFYWRVRLIDEVKNELAISKSRKFTVLKKLIDPLIRHPMHQQVVDMSFHESLDFSWKPVKGATHYLFSLYHEVKNRRAINRKLIISKKTQKNEISIRTLKILDVGNFIWTLKALKVDSSGKVIISSSEVKKRLKIILSEESTQSKIEFISPLNQAVP